MINRLLFLFFIGALGLLAFGTGWAISHYDMGVVNLWITQSVEQASHKLNLETDEVASDTPPPVLKEVPNAKGSTQTVLEARGMDFYPEAFKGLPPLLIISSGEYHFMVEDTPNGLQVEPIINNQEKLRGEAYIIQNNQIFMQKRADKETEFYSLMRFKDDEIEALWRKSINQPLHHFGEIFNDVAYVPSREFIVMPNAEMKELYGEKPFSKCDHEHTMADTITLFDMNTGAILETIKLLPIVAGISNIYLENAMALICQDSLHLNDVRVVRNQTQADLFPGGKVGDILVSMRNINTIMLIDKDTKESKWRITGQFHHQHSPRITRRGTMLVFDNLGSLPDGGLSRILEFDIKTKDLLGIYEAPESELFQSRVKGRIQLVNDRIFIQEHAGGHLFELICPDTYISDKCTRQNLFRIDSEDPKDRNFNLAEFIYSQ